MDSARLSSTNRRCWSQLYARLCHSPALPLELVINKVGKLSVCKTWKHVCVIFTLPLGKVATVLKLYQSQRMLALSLTETESSSWREDSLQEMPLPPKKMQVWRNFILNLILKLSKCNFVSASCSVEQPMPVTTKCIVSLPEGLQTIHYQLQRFFLSNCKKKSCFKASMMRSATDAMARCLNDEENHAACEQHLKYVTD